MLIKKGRRGGKSIWECDCCKVAFETPNPRATEALRNNAKKFCGWDCRKEYARIVDSKRVVEWVKANGHPRITTRCGLTTDGYVWIYLKGRHNNQVKLHRYLMEVKLGRPLDPKEIVHHVDEDKLNNCIDNLELTTIAEHNRMHNSLRNYEKEMGVSWSEEEDMAAVVLKYEEFSALYKRTHGAYSQRKRRLKEKGHGT